MGVAIAPEKITSHKRLGRERDVGLRRREDFAGERRIRETALGAEEADELANAASPRERELHR